MMIANLMLKEASSSSGLVTWYLTRNMAICSYIALTLTVLLGLTITLARNTGERVVWQLQDLHYTLATLTGVLIIGHMATLYFDTFMQFSLGNLLLPLNQPTDTLTVDLGVIGFYGMVTLLLTSWLKKRMSYTIWRIIHYVSFATFVLVTLHGWLTGTDSATSLMISLYFGCTLAVVSVLAPRLFVSPKPHRGNPPQVVPLSLVIPLILGVVGTLTMFLLLNTFVQL